MYTNESFIVTRTLREQCVDRLDILNKVKALFLIPEANLMSTGMVAKFFDVPVKTIQTVFLRNKEGLESDGAKSLKLKDLNDTFTMKTSFLEKTQTGAIVTLEDGQKFQLSNRDSVYFTPRSVLRIAMLLRDSEVAKEVRTQLLNVVESVTPEKRVQEIDDEAILLLTVLRADGMENRAIALSDYRMFMNCRVKALEDTVDQLLDGARRMDFRRVVNCLIKAYANAYRGYNYGCTDKYQAAWNTLYYRLRNNFGIDVRRRKGDGRLLDKIHEDEQQTAIQVAAELAKSVGVDIVEVIGQLNVEEFALAS